MREVKRGKAVVVFLTYKNKGLYNYFFFRLYHIDDQPTGATAAEEVDFSKAFNVSPVISVAF